VFHTDIHLLGRVALACAIAFAFGFERQLRGSPAGNRTFVLIGGTAAAVTSVAGLTSPQAVAGILTGIGFIGAGLVFVHGATIRGLTSAATVFGVAGIGIVLGYGHLWLGLFVGVVFMFMFELQHIPGLRALDAKTFADRFANDYESRVPGLGEGTGTDDRNRIHDRNEHDGGAGNSGDKDGHNDNDGPAAGFPDTPPTRPGAH
jgi:putative Mg2+ transporter-C (MgtC) family protein